MAGSLELDVGYSRWIDTREDYLRETKTYPTFATGAINTPFSDCFLYFSSTFIYGELYMLYILDFLYKYSIPGSISDQYTRLSSFWPRESGVRLPARELIFLFFSFIL
jgi:hypothetical protein